MANERDPRTPALAPAATSSSDVRSRVVARNAPPELGEMFANRWELLRFLGEGGMGTVYEARDHLQGGHVALKVLTRAGAASVYRLKNEFRALADVSHPNLVRLHELGQHDERWFVVMDLVHGVDFASYVLDEDAQLHLPRLRLALAGLARGVHALHGAQKLHRDLKPSNVLVDADGRVKIVDFGLVSGPHLGAPGQTLEGIFSGTPAYASPEQLLGREQTSGSDWYAVGVMLYEALTGCSPGEPIRRANIESAGQIAHPADIDPSLPQDLCDLSLALLQYDPARRPTGAAVLEALGVDDSAETRVLSSRPSGFVGRDAELRRLSLAFERTRAGESGTLFVHGASGMGKTALVARFLEEIQHERAVILSSRCYAREQLPFKAFDAIVDQLSQLLSRLPDVEAAHLLPRDNAALMRMFPTLARVAAMASAPRPMQRNEDESATRARAFRALKEMLARISDRFALVVCIDDLQWGDLDSAQLFRELVCEPDAPNALWLGTYRSEERETSPMLQQLFADGGFRAKLQEIELGPLEPQEARELVELLNPEAEAARNEILEEAKGSPFFLTELTRYAREQGQLGAVRDVVLARAAGLSDVARGLLEVLCVAGQPVPQEVLVFAAQAEESDAARALVFASLARARSIAEVPHLEPYHDRIREAVSSHLSAERVQAINRSLAHGYERTARSDPEALVQFYLRAGDQSRAARFARDAAEKARNALAFDREAQLLRIAVQSAGDSSPHELHVSLAEALEKAGESYEAARAFAFAARDAGDAERASLQRCAMRLFLRSGHVDEGRAILREQCREVGLRLPRSPLWAYVSTALSLIVHRLRPRIDSWMVEAPLPLSSAQRQALEARFDVAWDAATAFLTYATEEAVWLVSRAFVMARRLRTPRAIALTGLFDDMWRHSVPLGGSRVGLSEHAERAMAVARSADRPELLAEALALHGTMKMYEGEVGSARDTYAEAERVLSEHGLAPQRVVSFLRVAELAVFFLSGNVHASKQHAARWLRQAEQSHDVFGQLALPVVGSPAWLVDDRPDLARRWLTDAFARSAGFEHPFASSVWWQAWVDLYTGEPDRALAHCDAAFRTWRFWVERLVEFNRALFLFTRGQALAACAARAPGDAALRKRLRKTTRALKRHRHFSLATALACQLTAHDALLAGRREEAERTFELAATLLDSQGLALFAAAREVRAAELRTPSDEHERERALSPFRERGIRNPERWLQMLAPV